MAVHCFHAGVFNVSITSEKSEMSGVTVTLDWTLESDSSLYSYNISIIPDQLNLTYIKSTGVILIVPYNTLYNVTVVAEHRCGQNNILLTTSIDLYYNFSKLIFVKFVIFESDMLSTVVIYTGTTFSAKCSYPNTNNASWTITVMGYSEPALVGTNISLTCPSGMVLNGPNTAMCTEGGQWEPNIRNVFCQGTIYCMIHFVSQTQY